MALSIDILIGAVLGLVITIVLFIKTKRSKRKQQFVLIIFNGFLTGFALYAGIASIIFGITGNLLFNQTDIISQRVMAFFGGLSIFSISIYYAFIKKS